MRRVVVTGLGLVTPLGCGVKTTWDRLVNGESGISGIQKFDVSDLPAKIAGMVPLGDKADGRFNPDEWVTPKDQKKMDRFITYAIAAATQAVEDSGCMSEDEEQLLRTGVMIGSGIGGLETIYDASTTLLEKGPRRIGPFFIPASLINLASGHVSIKYGFKGPNHAVVTACSTGAHAIGDAARLIALDDAEIKYSTVQNCYPGDKDGKGGVYNFVTKRGDCRGDRSKISWTQVETGSAITWKYPSCILRGDDSRGEFYSIAISNGRQQVDSGTKMIHLGKNTSSRIISKGISAGESSNTYRGLVSAHRKAKNARNFTQCDSLLIGDQCGAHTIPYIEAKTNTAHFEHEATTSKISDDQMFYCLSRGLNEEEAIALIVNGFAREVIQQLPMEFMAETQRLIGISLEGSVG